MMSSRIRSGHLTMWVEIRRHARTTLRAAAVLMCTAGAIPFWGFAQYPEKPITLLVGYGAGSAGDQIARGLAAAASKRLRQPILVVNRSSASGTHAIALGVFYDHRLKLGMSGVPTFKERGFEILLTTGQAVVAPHRTPASNVRILDEMVRKAVAEPRSSRLQRGRRIRSTTRRDGHNAGVIHQDVNAAEALDGSFDERLHFDALRDVDGEPDSLTAGGRNLVYDRVYTVLTPRSQDDLRSVSRKKLRRALSKSAAATGDDYNLLCN